MLDEFYSSRKKGISDLREKVDSKGNDIVGIHLVEYKSLEMSSCLVLSRDETVMFQ